MESERPARLDLSRQRTYGELLQATLQVFGSHADVLLTVALLLVAPATILVDGIWGRALADGPDAKPPLAAQGVSAALSVFVILPLITACVALVVQALGRGAAIGDLREALGAGARAFPRVLGAVVVYAAGVLAGLILLVVPGIWLAVRGYFAAQAAALDGLGPTAALRSSSDAVRGNWWRTLGCLFATAFLFGLTGSIAIGIFGATGSGAVYVAGATIVESVVVTLSAIFATLLFYDLRARRVRPVDPAVTK
ncbi:MAG: hypothetical protein QOH46_2022 [Solirubrobacteraceae bacterium]|nr:hypothetical protein [Solirubrobacteraceae bacterium]